MQFLLLIALALRHAEGGGDNCLLQTREGGRLQHELTVSCADSDTHCAWWAGQGWCQGTYASHVTGKCQASCGLCGGGGSTSGSFPSSTPTSTAAPAANSAQGGGAATGNTNAAQASAIECADSDSHCEYWAGQGWCQGKYASHVTGKCQASCGLCGGSGSTSGSSPSSTPSSTAAPATHSTQGGGASTGNTNAALASAIELANLINEYRMQNGKAAVPLSPAMMSSASVHVKDLILNTPGVPVSASQPDPCSLHSWSQLSSDSPGCCYKLSNPNGDCMWEKPKEHTTCWAQQYPGRGYENAWGPTQVTPQKCINAWKNSEHHNDVMLNLGVWSGVSFNPWPAMGVAIEGDYCVLWMGDAEDPAGTFMAEKASSHECCVPSQYCPSF